MFNAEAQRRRENAMRALTRDHESAPLGLHESSSAKASQVKWRSCELVSGGVVAGEVVPSVLSVPPVPLCFKIQTLSKVAAEGIRGGAARPRAQIESVGTYGTVYV